MKATTATVMYISGILEGQLGGGGGGYLVSYRFTKAKEF
jgi:hypothetical protein